MAEPNTDTPAAAPAPAPSPSTRDAVIAALGDDFGKDPESVDDGEGEGGEEAVVAESATTAEPAKEAAKPPEPKPEPLSPQLAELARRESKQRQEAATLKQEREAFAKERAEWESSKGSVDSLHGEVTSDIVAYAEKRKLSAEQRRAMADDLYWSTQPEDKRPQNYRQRTQVRSELEVIKEQAAKAAKMLEEFKAEQAKKEALAEQRVVQERVIGQVVAEIPETAKLTKAFLKHNPEQARADLWTIALQLAQANPNAELTPAQVAAEYERLLDKQSAWARSEVAPQIAPKGPPASTALTNERAASPAKAGNGVKDAATRRAEALASLADD